MTHVEVFTTNVSPSASLPIVALLMSILEGSLISFDHEDVDHVLRIASQSTVDTQIVLKVVAMFGFEARVMPDEVHQILAGGSQQL